MTGDKTKSVEEQEAERVVDLLEKKGLMSGKVGVFRKDPGPNGLNFMFLVERVAKDEVILLLLLLLLLFIHFRFPSQSTATPTAKPADEPCDDCLEEDLLSNFELELIIDIVQEKGFTKAVVVKKDTDGFKLLVVLGPCPDDKEPTITTDTVIFTVKNDAAEEVISLLLLMLFLFDSHTFPI